MRSRFASADKKNLVDSALFFVVGMALFLYGILSRDFSLPWSMSPFLFPLLISLLFLLLSGALFLQSLFRPVKKAPPAPTSWRNLAVTLGSLAGYFILLPIIHFVPSTILFLFGLLYALGERRIWVSAAIAVATSLLIYLVFHVFLSVTMP